MWSSYYDAICLYRAGGRWPETQTILDELVNILNTQKNRLEPQDSHTFSVSRPGSNNNEQPRKFRIHRDSNDTLIIHEIIVTATSETEQEIARGKFNTKNIGLGSDTSISSALERHFG